MILSFSLFEALGKKDFTNSLVLGHLFVGPVFTLLLGMFIARSRPVEVFAHIRHTPVKEVPDLVRTDI